MAELLKNTTNAKRGGNVGGKPHSKGGVKAIIKDTGAPVEIERGEVVINAAASRKHWKTLSQINQSAGNGVAIGPPSDVDITVDEPTLKNGGRVDFKLNQLPREFIVNFAAKIKTKHPKVWAMASNVYGNEAFSNLQRVLKRGIWLEKEGWMFEKWQAFPLEKKASHRIEDLITALKWCTVSDMGWTAMRETILNETKRAAGKKTKNIKLEEEIKKGTEIEKEHLETATKLYNHQITPAEAPESIAKEHLKEGVNYYKLLDEMEAKLYKQPKVGQFNEHIGIHRNKGVLALAGFKTILEHHPEHIDLSRDLGLFATHISANKLNDDVFFIGVSEWATIITIPSEYDFLKENLHGIYLETFNTYLKTIYQLHPEIENWEQFIDRAGELPNPSDAIYELRKHTIALLHEAVGPFDVLKIEDPATGAPTQYLILNNELLPAKFEKGGSVGTGAKNKMSTLKGILISGSASNNELTDNNNERLFNATLKNINPQDTQYYQFFIEGNIIGGSLLYNPLERTIGRYKYVGGYSATSLSTFQPLTQSEEEELYQDVRRGMVKIIRRGRQYPLNQTENILLSLPPKAKPTTTEESDLNLTSLSQNERKFLLQITERGSKGEIYSKVKLEKIGKENGITNQNTIKELTELSLCIRSRRIIEPIFNSTTEPGAVKVEKLAYNSLVQLYEGQPNLSHRTSESVLLQQYSTPAPIGYLAGLFCGFNGDGHYFEPSAGNGLLTIAGKPENFIVNEIDETRNKHLKTQGFEQVLKQDATQPFAGYEKAFDAVITNPPFGKTGAVSYGGVEIKSLEQLMALRALDCMKDHGRAAIIIGGHQTYDAEGRIQAGKNRTFFVYLYHEYHVLDVINIDGHSLYSRQGTGFNTRLILIAGRKKTPQGFPPLIEKPLPETEKNSYTPIKSFQTLWERVSQYF